MNNLAQRLAKTFKVAEIEPPESEKYQQVPKWKDGPDEACLIVHRDYHEMKTGEGYPDYYPDYSTDELLRILPSEINGHEFFMKKLYKGVPSSYTGYYELFSFWGYKDPKTALTELLKWALKEHPDAVRDNIKEMK